MSDPCTKGEVIDEVSRQTTANGTQIEHLVAALTTLTSQFQTCMTEVRAMYGDDREAVSRLRRAEKDIDSLFNGQRKLEEHISAKIDVMNASTSVKLDKIDKSLADKLDPIVAWKNRVEGGWWLVKALPAIAAAVSVLAALVAVGAFK